MDLKAAVINDMSGLGRCSLVADITVLGALGVQPCPVPTAVLTGQTGYPGYHCRDLTEDLPYYRKHWSEIGLKTDGILTGFLNGADQAACVNDFICTFANDRTRTTLLVDPVMADGGHVYANYSPELLGEIRKLSQMADIITPNVSELFLLAGRRPEETEGVPEAALQREIMELAEELSEKNGMSENSLSQASGKGGRTVIVTGVPASSELIGNLLVGPGVRRLYTFPKNGGNYSGTGDIFAAAVLGGRLQGIPWDDLITCVGTLISEGVKEAAGSGTDCNDGIPYEQHLGMLTDLVKGRQTD